MGKAQRFPRERELKVAWSSLPFRDTAETELCLSNEKLEQLAKRARTRRLWFSAVACLLLLAFIVWLAVSQSTLRQAQTVARVDLRGQVPTRGIENSPSYRPVIISKQARTLEILLPVGSDEGDFEIAVVRADGKPLLTTTARARFESGLIKIKLPVGLGPFSEGSYFLALRSERSGWQYYPFILK